MAIKRQKQNPVSLEALRKGLTDEQRAILNAIWNFDEKRRIAPASALYTQFTKERLENATKLLGGSIVYRTSDLEGGRKFYRLTFLGSLLTSKGEEIEKMIVGYMEYVQSQVKAMPTLDHIRESEVRAVLNWDREQTDFFKDSLSNSPFWNGGSDDVEGFNFRLPRNVDDLVSVSDVHAYVQGIVLEAYDPDKPVDLGPLYGYPPPRDKTGSTIEDLEPFRLSAKQLWVLCLGFYVLYFFYKLFSIVQTKGLPSINMSDTWGEVLSGTLWLLPIIFAILLLLLVLGEDNFRRFVRQLSIVAKVRRTFLFNPEESTDTVDAPGRRSPVDTGQDAVAGEPGFGDKYYQEFQQTVKRVYNNAILQYGISFFFSLIFSVIGFGLIFYALVYKADANPNWPAVFVSAVIQSIPALFFYLSDRARRQMLEVFSDMRRDNDVARAYGVIETVKNADKQESLKEEIIRKVLIASEEQTALRARKE
jgi:heme/copper-type cytochrome/quinol oxidase subunit 4